MSREIFLGINREIGNKSIAFIFLKESVSGWLRYSEVNTIH